jgi:ArsR family transcriptional regulator, arsenate/arsenite/antimonite-responsive transcriptional repressor
MKLSNLARIFKALSSEQRLKIFEMLYRMGRKGTCCTPVEKGFSKACTQIDISPSTVSHHFKELENAGLISCSRNGQAVSCTVNDEALKLIREFIG